MLIQFMARAAILAVGLFGTAYYNAHAADLGGNCCADLEERVAELEATTARKGNRKMSVVIYGSVNKALLWNNFGPENSKQVVDGATPTVVGIQGEGKISANWKAGFKVELGVDNYISLPNGDGVALVREAMVYVDGVVGKVSLGRTSMATDTVGEISLANTQVAAPLLSLQPLGNAVAFGLDLPYDGIRRNVVRYDSPGMGGLMLSASLASSDAVINGVNAKDIWDVAVRYAGEFAGIRVAAGLGYRQENHLPGGNAAFFLPHDHVIVGSASVKHMGSGLFVTVAGGQGLEVFASGGPDHLTWHGQAGLEKNLFGFGAFTIYGEYATMDIKMAGAPTPTMMGLGAVQAIDSAATDLYVSWRRFDLDGMNAFGGGTRDTGDQFMLGARVKF